MGLDVYSHLVVGALVKDDEIFTVASKVEFKCSTCRAAHAAGQKFCGECGHKFASITVRAWTPGVLGYLECASRTEVHPDDIRRYDEAPFFHVDAIQSGEEEPTLIAVGFKFKGPSMRDRTPNSDGIPFERLDTYRREVDGMVAAMGLAPREVRLYPCMYISC
jgi:hypothetical protein